MELAEPAAEAGAGDEAAPGLADDGGADEAGGLGGREAKEDLLDELLYHQRRRRRRRRRHAGCGASDGKGEDWLPI